MKFLQFLIMSEMADKGKEVRAAYDKHLRTSRNKLQPGVFVDYTKLPWQFSIVTGRLAQQMQARLDPLGRRESGQAVFVNAPQGPETFMAAHTVPPGIFEMIGRIQ
jgi:hypothetical protein